MSRPLCVVTGTSSGLGLAVAGRLLALGWRVLGVARREAPLSDPAYRHCRVDLGDPAAVEALCAGALAEALAADAPRLGLVNGAAALDPVGPVHRLPMAALVRALAVNAAAPLRLTGALVAGAGGRPLRVVDVSSGAAGRAYPGWGAYCASKAALRMGGQVAAEERAAFAGAGQAGTDLAVVSYEPGVVDTAMQAAVRATPREDFPSVDRFIGLHAQGRLVDPRRPAEEICALLGRDDLPAFSVLRHGG